MAYVVGSVSVEVVPDFRNAQNAITAWFKSQPDSFKIPVKPEFDKSATSAAVRDAAAVGSKTGKAMADAQRAQTDKALAASIASAEKAAYREAAIRERALAREAAAREKANAQVLILAERAAYREAEIREKAALREEADRGKSLARVLAAAERAAYREEEIRKKSLARQEVEAKRSVERALAEELKIEKRGIDERTRLIEQESRSAYRIRVDSARRTGAAIKAALGLSRTAAAQEEKIRLQIEIDERKAIEAGKRTGGLVARAVKQEVHQNAGLIAAAIGAALVAGAPVALAGAVALFAGIGAVAAAQSQRVRSAWVGAWDEIRAGAISDAAVLVPVFERMSVQISQSFQRMRPALRDAFEAVGPQLESFTAALTEAAESALPGLVRAVQAGGPVIQGMGVFVKDVGTGLSNFFDILATHAPAAGEVFGDLGQTMATLLPTLGELLGQGAELAAIVLPAVNGSLGVLLSVLQKVGPALPIIGAGFLAFRAAKGAGDYLSNLAVKLQKAGLEGGLFAGAAGRAGTAVSALGKALPAVGIAAGVVAAGLAAAEQITNDWRDAMLAGGRAAQTAATQTLALENFWRSSALGAHLGFLEPLADMVGLGADAYGDAARESREYLSSLDPLTRAQAILVRETADVATAIADHGESSVEAQTALLIYRAALERVADEQARLEAATTGVTEAMVAQGEQARALADSAFAYEESLNDLEDAQEDYNTALAEGNEEDKSRALLDLQMAYSDVANAARDMALDALPAELDAKQASILADKAQLDALLALKSEYGDLGPILENQIAELTASTSGANANALAQAQLAAALTQVGVEVEAIPGEKAVIITAPTEDQKQRLRDLGFTVTEIPGTKDVRVSADTAEAEANLDKIDTELAGLDDTTAIPEVDINDIPFFGGYQNVMAAAQRIHMQRPTPQAFLRDNASPPLRSLLTFIGVVGGQRPTPQAFLRDNASSPLRSLLGTIGVVGGQRPTPTAALNDLASGPLRGVLGLLAGVPGTRTATINIDTVYRTFGTPAGGAPLSVAAPNRRDGGTVPEMHVPRYGTGGWPRFDGAVYGRGGPRDDLQPALVSPLEHILDAADVASMGGQAGVYAFREMLSSGNLGASFDVRKLAAGAGPGERAPAMATKREVNLYTPDIPHAIRALRADEQQQAALAPVW